MWFVHHLILYLERPTEAVVCPTEAVVWPAEGEAATEAPASRPSSSKEAEAITPTTRAAAAAGPGAEAATSLPSDMFGENPKHGSIFFF